MNSKLICVMIFLGLCFGFSYMKPKVVSNSKSLLVYEVPYSKLKLSLQSLTEKNYKIIDPNMLKIYFSRDFAKPKSEYVVLAKVKYSGVGQFSAEVGGRELFVYHSSLGSGLEQYETVVVIFVNTPFINVKTMSFSVE